MYKFSMEIRRYNGIMKSRLRSTRTIGITILAFSCLLLIWLLWPFSRTTQEISFKPGEITFESAIDPNIISDQDAPVLAMPVGIHLILDWVPVIRKGGSEVIHLQVIPDQLVAEGNGSNDPGINTITLGALNLFDGYSFMLKTRLDMVNVIMDPPGESGSVLSESNNASFSWKITPQVSEDLHGTVWFFLVAFPDGGGELISKAVSAQDIDFKVISLLGLHVAFLWIVAGIGFIGGVFLTLGLFSQKFKIDNSGKGKIRSNQKQKRT